MIEELNRHRADVAEACRRFGVVRLDLFGSAAGGDFDRTRSDVDLLVVIEPPAGMSRFEAYFGLKEALESILGLPVDLVTPSALANPYFARAVEQTREPLYAA